MVGRWKTLKRLLEEKKNPLDYKLLLTTATLRDASTIKEKGGEKRPLFNISIVVIVSCSCSCCSQSCSTNNTQEKMVHSFAKSKRDPNGLSLDRTVSQKEKKKVVMPISCRLRMGLQLGKWKPHVVRLGRSWIGMDDSTLFSLISGKLISKSIIVFVTGNATEVLFHVTVMSLDTIDESSMVSKILRQKSLFSKNQSG